MVRTIQVAVDADGNYTKSALGFAKKNNASIDSLFIEDDYVYANVHIAGKQATELLETELSKVLASISFIKTMRWDSDASFSRPVRWLYAALGDAPVNVSYAQTLHSSTETRSGAIFPP